MNLRKQFSAAFPSLAISETFGTGPGGKDDMFVFDVDVGNKITN
jgi:hypothetical protein